MSDDFLPPSTTDQIHGLRSWSAENRAAFFEDGPVLINRVAVALGIPEDLCSEIVDLTFKRVFKVGGGFDGEGDLWAWVKGIVESIVQEKKWLPGWSAERPNGSFEAICDACAKAARKLKCPEDLVGDVVNETFLRLRNQTRAFESSDALIAWAYGTAKNVTREFKRKMSRLGSQLDVDVSAQVPSLFDEVWHRERLVLVKARLSRMSGKQGEVASSILVDGLSVEEAMALHNVSASYVYTATSRGRSSIKDLAEGLDDE